MLEELWLDVPVALEVDPPSKILVLLFCPWVVSRYRTDSARMLSSSCILWLGWFSPQLLVPVSVVCACFADAFSTSAAGTTQKLPAPIFVMIQKHESKRETTFSQQNKENYKCNKSSGLPAQACGFVWCKGGAALGSFISFSCLEAIIAKQWLPVFFQLHLFPLLNIIIWVDP